MDERHYRPKVILPRRIKADLVDDAITAAIMLGPLLAGQGLTGALPDSILRLFVLGIPVGIGYFLFRDSVGFGTSAGKRLLGLPLIRLADGKPCTPGRVWARNLVDPIPLLGLVDFVWMCFDTHGQKLMDRKLGTQVVEISESDGSTGSAPPARYLPSKGRRVAVVLVYWALSFLAVALTATMTVSAPCLGSDRCSSRDEELLGILGVAWLALLVGIGAAGWFGWLWGARGRSA
jgi:uncharacterized RDD family membrane protein YckC